MGFPFETASWDGISGPIFMGYQSAFPGVCTAIAIGLCVLTLVLGQKSEAAKYAKYK
jgi:hypothetical protein